MSPRAKQVKELDRFKLEVKFTNGEVRIFDMTPLLKLPVYQPLKDHAYFERVFIDQGIVPWPNEIDVSPDSLYLNGQAVV